MSARILYVDDEPDIREVAAMALELDADLEVKSVASGAEALDLAATWRPQLILLDVMMPDMDDPATLAELSIGVQTGPPIGAQKGPPLHDGGSQRPPRKLPPNVAAYHLKTGDPIDAARALQFGLVIEIHESSETIARAVAIASAVAERSPTAVRAIKSCTATAVGATADNGLTFERDAITALTETEDSKEGMRAFAEKRPPKFVGS